MEKRLNKQTNQQPTNAIPNQSLRQDDSNKIKKLGGIHLYNQTYKRYLSSQSVDRTNKKTNILINQCDHQDQQQQIIEREIKDFIQHRESLNFNISTAFTSELENIIQTLKHSHVSTNRFLEQHQQYKQSMNSHAVFSFQELFQSQKNKSKNKENQLTKTILNQLNKNIMQELNRMKEEQAQNKRIRQSLRRQISVQTINYHQNQLLYLRKELQRRQVQYNALYNYKKDMLNEGQNIIKNHEINIELQKALISKLENEVASKNYQVKTLKIQFKQAQDKLVAKMLQLQKIYTISQARSSLSSIQQSVNSNDMVRQNQVISSFINKINNKKPRLKKRAQSILSITHSLFSNKKDKDDLVASMADFTAESLRQTNVHFDKEFDDQFIQILKKSSKKSPNLFKILEFYQKNKNKSQKNSKKIKNIGSSIRSNPYSNKAKMAAKIQQQYIKLSSRRQQTESMKSKERQRIQEQEYSDQNQSFTQESIPAKTNKIKRQLSFQQNIENQNIEEKTSILRPSFKDLSVIQQNSSYYNQKSNKNKYKKGVSFQINSSETISNLDLHSQIVSIFIVGLSKRQSSQTPFTDNLINEKNRQPNLQMFDKLRFSKNKLIKTKIKEKTHQKVNSAFESQTLSTFGGNSTNEKSLNSQNRGSTTACQLSRFSNQKQRFSCHNSQQKFINSNQQNNSRQRNSYSRLQRPSINFNAINGKSENEKQGKTAKQMALKCKDRDEYYDKLVKLHKGCAQNCQHIRKYLQFFDKCRQRPRKDQFKLNIENINSHIKQKSLPLLSKGTK